MSVWESLEALQQFVYAGAHVGSLRDRKQWLSRSDGPILALWWIPAGHIPTVAEAQERLRILETVDRRPRPSRSKRRVSSADAAGRVLYRL